MWLTAFREADIKELMNGRRRGVITENSDVRDHHMLIMMMMTT